MAEQDENERTEEPTQKKIDDAIKRGDVAKSQEVNTWFVMAGGTLAIALFASGPALELTTTFKGVLAGAHLVSFDGAGLRSASLELVAAAARAVALPLVLLAAAGLFGSIIQHRLIFTTEPLKPQLSRISPLGGLKRLASKQSLAGFVKGLLKLGIVGAVLLTVLWPERARMPLLVASDLPTTLDVLMDLIMEVLIASVVVLGLVAGADFLYQRFEWLKRQRMSVREIREEFKQSEGDPHIKARVRQIRMERARKRMMAEVPKATVVVANPTHFAVALRYEKGMAAPLCLAKGVDAVALKIREVAEGAGVPVVENPPLARALYAATEVDREIPVEHYKAVAEIIGYIWRRKRGR